MKYKNDKMKAYADQKLLENNDPIRKEYSLYSNNCGTFARDVISQDPNVDNPSIWNPTPKNIINKYINEGNAEVDYDPTKNTTTIGQGNENDAKKSGSTKSTSSINPTSQAQIASLLSSWLQINPNIQVSIE